MRPNHLATIALVLALTTVPATGLASSHADHEDQEDRTPAEAFTDITEAFDGDRPGDAASTYQQAFASHAKVAPTAADAVDAALDAAQNAEPGSPAYALNTQIAEKGVLAISYHVVQDAAQAGDHQTAQAYVDVLTTKFDAEEQLAETEAAFADEDTPLDEAATTLATEYGDLIAAKVYAETRETPELLDAGEPTTAAKEAGEALGYGLSLHDHLERTLGQDAVDTFHDELQGLAEHTLAEDAQGVNAEAEEILALLAEHGVATLPAEKLDARQAYLDAIDEQRYDDARSLYDEAFADDAASYAPEAHQAVLDTFDRVEQSERADRGVEHQRLAKHLLAIAWNVGFHELAEDETHEGLAFLAVLADKLGDLDEPDELATHLGHVEASDDAGNEHAQAFRDALTDALTDKVIAEIDEVFINWNDTETAREKAIEGVLYFQPIEEEVAATLSEEDAEHLDAELRGLYNATTAGDREEAEHEADEARQLLTSFANAGQDVSELGQTLDAIERTLSIITVEIEEYFAYQEEGNDAKAQEEIEESKAFIGKAMSTVDENRQALADADEQALADVEANMEEIQTLLAEEQDIDRIPDLVDETIARLDAFRQAAEPPQGPAIDVRFGDPEPTDAGAYKVPVLLTDAPDDGYTVQATVTYDPDVVTVDRVEIPAQVGAETTSEGEVRFNAASTDADPNPVVAELYLSPAEPGTSAELDLDVETLTDGQGDARPVGNVTGGDLDLASIEGTAATTDVPLGVASGLLAATVTALLARVRR